MVPELHVLALVSVSVPACPDRKIAATCVEPAGQTADMERTVTKTELPNGSSCQIGCRTNAQRPAAGHAQISRHLHVNRAGVCVVITGCGRDGVTARGRRHWHEREPGDECDEGDDALHGAPLPW